MQAIVRDLAAQMRKEPEQKREDYAENQARHDRKIERCVLAAMNNISRKTPKPERESPSEIQQRTNHRDNDTQKQQRPPEFPQRLHP